MNGILNVEIAGNRKLMKPWSSHFTQFDIELEHHTGGICAHRKDGLPILTPKPASKHLQQLNGKGRVQLYALALAPQVTILIYNMYGWTGANHHKEAAKRTSDLLDAILSDMQAQPQGPAIIMGDLNGDPSTFPNLTHQQKRGNLIDVGEQAHQWGQPSSAYTCKAKNAKKPTRRDYMFGNPAAFNLIAHFKVDHDSDLETHSILQVWLQVPSTGLNQVTKCIKPRPLEPLLLNLLPPPNQQHQQPAAGNTNTDDNKHETQDKYTKQRQQQQWPSLATQASGEDETGNLLPKRSMYTQEQLQWVKDGLSHSMDQTLDQSSNELSNLYDKRDAEAFLQLWTRCFEDSILQHTNTPGYLRKIQRKGPDQHQTAMDSKIREA